MFTCRMLRRALTGRSVRLRPLAQARHSSSAIVESTMSPITIPSITVQEKIFQNIDKWPDHMAIKCCMSGREYTYSQLDEFSKRVAAGFIKAGLKPGQAVSFVLPNIPEFMIALLGALRAGLIVSTINPIYTPEEISYQLINGDAKLVLTFMLKIDEVKAAVEKVQGPKPLISIIHQPSDELPEGCNSFMELLMVEDEEVEAVDKIKINPDDCALLLYSSGTTGLPKGVRLTHKNIVSNICQVEHPYLSPVIPTTSDNQDTTACVLPFFHVYGLVTGGLAYLASGARLLTIPRFEPEMFLSALKDHKTNIIHVVPPLVQFLANHPSVTPEHFDSLRIAINGAAMVSQVDAHKFVDKKKGLKLISGYGLTESSPVITAGLMSDEPPVALESCGMLVANTRIKLIDPDTGALIEKGKPGEICVQGPQIMSGYHKNKEATDSTIIDGYLHTGDVGYFENGYLFIVDRIKELIKVKGLQVAPLEIEGVLREHPGVIDCGVVGKPDPRFGEVPVAFVVAGENKPSAKDLQDYVASKVAEYKQIGEVIFIESIPKNLTGKILRRSLKEMLTKG